MDKLMYLAAVAWIAGLYALATTGALAPLARVTAALAKATGGHTSYPFGLVAAMLGFLFFAALSAGTN